jgi:hypothetical protein
MHCVVSECRKIMIHQQIAKPYQLSIHCIQNKRKNRKDYQRYFDYVLRVMLKIFFSSPVVYFAVVTTSDRLVFRSFPVALSSGTFITSAFGQNLVSGLEHIPGLLFVSGTRAITARPPH